LHSQAYKGIDEYRPENLYMVCGDPNIEDLVGRLHNLASGNDEDFSQVNHFCFFY
jgi:hypothetical protein